MRRFLLKIKLFFTSEDFIALSLLAVNIASIFYCVYTVSTASVLFFLLTTLALVIGMRVMTTTYQDLSDSFVAFIMLNVLKSIIAVLLGVIVSIYYSEVVYDVVSSNVKYLPIIEYNSKGQVIVKQDSELRVFSDSKIGEKFLRNDKKGFIKYEENTYKKTWI